MSRRIPLLFAIAACSLAGFAARTKLQSYLINTRTLSPILKITTPSAGASCSAKELQLTLTPGMPLSVRTCENGRCFTSDPNALSFYDRFSRVGATELGLGAGFPRTRSVEPTTGPDGLLWLCRTNEETQQCECIPWFQD
ncbi:MAG: hypothetical protein FJW38_20130 [Acidobacteria bacterium]|nr:hypothetical protein [Acidobacteriota bacterium]